MLKTNEISSVIQWRWVLWIFGTLYFLAWTSGYWNRVKEPLKNAAEKNFLRSLSAVCFSFFILAFLGKYSQLCSLQLNAQDFWLFVDILEQLKKGGAFLSRFAPQSIGYVQHGAVHPMFTWSMMLPISWVVGSTTASLLFGPAVFSGAGFLIGILARKRWGALGALFFSIAFLSSTQVGKVLMYDVHPEAAYPFFVLLWLWAIHWGEAAEKVKWVGVVTAILLGMGIKEDSFLIFAPWLLLGAFRLKTPQQRKALWVSTTLATGVFILQILAVKNWTQGSWGPSEWEGFPVITSAGVSVFKGAHWSSIQDIEQIIRQLLAEQGGILGVLKGVAKFLLSRPWISIVILAPWVVLEGQFWILILPLAFVYSMLEGPRVLWNYYSAPFLGTFWFWAISAQRKLEGFSTRLKNLPDFRPNWTFCAALLLGSGSIVFYLPKTEIAEIKEQVTTYLPCLRNRGLVPSHLLGWVPLHQVWTDRVPKTSTEWDQVDFVLFTPEIGRYELSLEQSQELYRFLLNQKNWNLIGTDCRKLEKPPQLKSNSVILLIKESSKSVSP